MPELDRCPTPAAALVSLAGRFDRFTPDLVVCDEVQPTEMPPWAVHLLVHEHHMTRVLSEHHGRKLDLYVMQERLETPFYSRKIFLTAGAGDAVEYGLVRLDLRQISAVARMEILRHEAPLGAVLMRHSPLREIHPRWFLRFAAGSPLLRWMGAKLRHDAYGRIGVIWCDHRPAVEVLEIVPHPEEKQ